MNSYRLPAEWEEHRATWLAWPHNKEDWLGQIEPVWKAYLSFIKELTKSEKVEILCKEPDELQPILLESKLNLSQINLHQVKTNRSWLRDSMPFSVKEKSSGEKIWLAALFNAWAKYDDFQLDQNVPEQVSKISNIPLSYIYKDQEKAERLVLEGGAIESNGKGTLIVTEECLLSKVQERNPGLKKEDYEQLFLKYFSTEKIIWLKAGVVGDDTHGHIDDVARFVSENAVLLAYSTKESNFREVSKQNLEILKKSKNAQNESIEIFLLPMPQPIIESGEQLPASYANFYITNESVLVPVFKDKADDLALRVIDDSFSGRNTMPIDSRDLILGCGALHCATQQEVK